MVVTENDINEGNNNTSEVKRFKILISQCEFKIYNLVTILIKEI